MVLNIIIVLKDGKKLQNNNFIMNALGVLSLNHVFKQIPLKYKMKF